MSHSRHQSEDYLLEFNARIIGENLRVRRDCPICPTLDLFPVSYLVRLQ